MHPAFSVVFFTTATGAGYGLLIWLGLFAFAGKLPPDRWLGIASVGIALALITAGLLSSTLHLGRPERAWRAFSQWRSSWLSREGVASVITYIPAGLFAFGWIFLGRTDGTFAIAGLVAAVCALVTLVTTGMIYASLKPIPQWASRYTVPGYLIYALMSGAVILNAIIHIVGIGVAAISWIAVISTAMGWIWKSLTWCHNDALALPVTASSAIGLEAGSVRSVEWPHSQANYVMKEMGYRIARKHAARLRVVVHLCAFTIPLLATVIVALELGMGPIAAVIAVVVQAAGLLVERWLFFAEATHVVGLYYGLHPDGHAAA